VSRKKTYVGTSVMRVIEDDRLPNSVKTGTLTAILRDGDMTEYVLEEMVRNIGTRAERMYAYAENHYTHGLPSGQFTIGAETLDTDIAAVLATVEGAPVTLDYVRYGAPNNLHIGWMALLASHAYDPVTNVLGNLTITKGATVYLKDMVVVVPESELASIEPRSLEQWGLAAKSGPAPNRPWTTGATRAMILPTPVQVDNEATSEFLRVEYIWESGSGEGGAEYTTESLEIPITGFDDEADYFHVKYEIGGVTKYWMYKDGLGTYPELDAVFDSPSEPNGTFFPFAYFRFNGVSELDDTSSESYKTNKKLVKYLGLDYDSVAENINENPDIDDVEQAMLMMAVPATTTDPLEQRYLWEFFNNVYLASSPDNRYRSEEEAASYAANVTMSPEQFGVRAPGIVIQDARFKLSLDNLGIYKRRKAGNLGPVGTFESSFSSKNTTYMFTNVNASTGVVESYPMNVPISSHFYRRQISDGYYEEIQVVELRTVFHIFGKYSAIGDDDDSILLIPLDRSITSDFSIPDRERLYARSLHFVFNSVVVIKVKWYETGIFKAFLIIVAIVVLIYTTDPTALAAAIKIGAYQVASMIILKGILTYLVTSVAFQLFVKAVGIEAAFWIAVIAAVAGVAMKFGSEALAGAPWAKDLLQIATGLTSGIQSNMADLMNGLAAEYKEFDALREEQIKLLETAQDLLDNKSMLSPFVIFGEKPEDFYNRTVHSGNIGVVGISAISTYVDQALKLPELNDSFGDSYA
jgi:hypothetical protein